MLRAAAVLALCVAPLPPALGVPTSLPIKAGFQAVWVTHGQSWPFCTWVLREHAGWESVRTRLVRQSGARQAAWAVMSCAAREPV